MSSQSQNIQVFVRCRPLGGHEKQAVVDVLPDRREVKVLDRYSTSHDTRNYYFDRVFSPDAKQEDIYTTVVRPLIDQVLLGFNCTVFAYGQTGTGKTYTMEGDRADETLSWEDDPGCGIIPRSINQLFDTLKDQENEFSVRVSFLELYNEDTYDLLSPIDDTTKLKIFDDANRKGSVIVGGLGEVIVQSKAEIYEILKRGSAKRQTAATFLNACSSRSHTIFSVTVHIKEGSIDAEELLKIGKLNLVDLAGSENIGRSGAQDKRAREAGNINQSLLTLGRVITALVEKRPHVPYRESKLTRLLQDSLGGKTKTSIIATISPCLPDLEDTLSTLDYASRAKKITNKPEMNQRLTKKALLREYENEIERLRRDLQATREKNGVYIDEENYKEMCKQLSAGSSTIKEKEDRLSALETKIDQDRKLFEEFTAQYEKTKAELDKAKEREQELKKLVSAQEETERQLASHATELIQVAEIATQDNHLLHSKKERIENILKENRANIDRYHPLVRDDIARLETSVQFMANEYVNGVDSFLDKSWRDFDSITEVVERMTDANKLQAQKHDTQAADYKRLSSDLKSQSDNISRQADHYESLAKECRAQSIALIKQSDDFLKFSRDHEEQAESLRNGDPTTKQIFTTMSNFKSTAKKDAESLKQTTSTLKSTVKREFGALKQKLEQVFTREFKEDIKTGSTPQRKNYDIPKRLVRTACDTIIEKQ